MYGLKEFLSSPSTGEALAVHGALQIAKAMQCGSIQLIRSVARWVPLHNLHSSVDWFVIPLSLFSSVFLDQALCIK